MKMNANWKKKIKTLLIIHLYKVFVEFKQHILLLMVQQKEIISVTGVRLQELTVKVSERYRENAGLPGRILSS